MSHLVRMFEVVTADDAHRLLRQLTGDPAAAFRPGQLDAIQRLVDDIVDSRWTLTVIGFALREAGCDEVYPLALAEARST